MNYSLRYDINIIEQLIKEVKLYNLRRNNNHSIENLFIISSFIENKLIINKSKEYKDYIKNKKKVIHNIYEMYIWVQNDKISRKDFKNIII